MGMKFSTSINMCLTKRSTGLADFLFLSLFFLSLIFLMSVCLLSSLDTAYYICRICLVS